MTTHEIAKVNDELSKISDTLFRSYTRIDGIDVLLRSMLTRAARHTEQARQALADAERYLGQRGNVTHE